MEEEGGTEDQLQLHPRQPRGVKFILTTFLLKVSLQEERLTGVMEELFPKREAHGVDQSGYAGAPGTSPFQTTCIEECGWLPISSCCLL